MATPLASIRVLFIASASQAATAIAEALDGAFNATIVQVSSTAGLRSALAETGSDVAIYHAGASFSVQTALKVILERGFDIPVIVVAGDDGGETLLIALASGARDVIAQDRISRLGPVITRELRESTRRAEHQAALEMLRDSESRFRAMVSNLPGMLFHLCRDANGDYRFLYVSEGCQKLVGRKQQELRASAHLFFEAFAADERYSLHEALNLSASNGTLLNWEGQTVARARSKWLNLRSMPQPRTGGAVEWQGIATNISHSKSIEEELRASRTQLAELSSHLEAVKEEERERIARDIHDELGSILVRLKIEVALLSGKLPESLSPLRDKSHSIEDLLNQAMSTASRVARELRPGILNEFGLAEALKCQAEDFSQRFNINCMMQCDEECSEPNPDTALALFRIAQEALTNVAKHAHASLVAMRLWHEHGNIHLEIRDNGRGFSEADMNKPKSFGLRGVRERVLSLSGTFAIKPGEQGGTYISVAIPAFGQPIQLTEEEPQRTLF